MCSTRGVTADYVAECHVSQVSDSVLASCSKEEKVKVNFGAEPFKYDLQVQLVNRVGWCLANFALLRSM